MTSCSYDEQKEKGGGECKRIKPWGNVPSWVSTEPSFLVIFPLHLRCNVIWHQVKIILKTQTVSNPLFWHVEWSAFQDNTHKAKYVASCPEVPSPGLFQQEQNTKHLCPRNRIQNCCFCLWNVEWSYIMACWNWSAYLSTWTLWFKHAKMLYCLYLLNFNLIKSLKKALQYKPVFV